MMADHRFRNRRNLPGSRLVATALLSMLCFVLGDAAPVRAGGAPELAALGATRERPLFTASRRAPPPAPEKPRAITQPAQPPDVVLSAVIVGGDVEMAFLKRGKDKAFPVRTGADVDGWAVTQIAPRYVVLERNSRSVTLEFPKRGGGSVSTVAAIVTPRTGPARP